MAAFSRLISSVRVPFEQFLPGRLGHRSPITDPESQISQSQRSDAAMVTIETEETRLQKTVKIVFGFAFTLSVTIIMTKARNHGEHILYEASAVLALICFFAAVGLLISVLAEVSGELAQRAQIVLMVIAIISLIASVMAIAMNAVI